MQEEVLSPLCLGQQWPVSKCVLCSFLRERARHNQQICTARSCVYSCLAPLQMQVSRAAIEERGHIWVCEESECGEGKILLLRLGASRTLLIYGSSRACLAVHLIAHGLLTVPAQTLLLSKAKL